LEGTRVSARAALFSGPSLGFWCLLGLPGLARSRTRMPPELSSDELRVLVAGLRAGHRDALDRAFDALRPRVFSLLVRMTKDSALAEDLTQEAFIRLARSAPNLEPDTRLDAWLVTVARNLALDHF